MYEATSQGVSADVTVGAPVWSLQMRARELIDRLRSGAAELRTEETEEDKLGLMDKAWDLAEELEFALKALEPR